VVGVGPAAAALGRRLRDGPADRLAGLRGCLLAGEVPLLLLLGPAALLPWADGVVYLGREPDAPRLLVPTTLIADVPAALLARAAAARSGSGAVALLPASGALIDLSGAGAIEPAALAAWLAPPRGDG